MGDVAQGVCWRVSAALGWAGRFFMIETCRNCGDRGI